MKMSSGVDSDRHDLTGDEVPGNGGFITNEFLREIVRRHEKEKDVRVVGSDVRAIVSTGDSYFSIMYRVEVEFVRESDGSGERRRFMVKSLPTAKIFRHIAQKYDIFRKEAFVYNVCLPEMRKLMKDHMPEEADFIAARSYECNLPDTIVMEDLKLSGYRMTDRRKQMDFEHSVMAVRVLARFHALSFKLVSARPEIIEEISLNDFYTDTKTDFMYENVMKALKSWLKVMAEQEATRKFVPVLRRVTENVLNKVIHVTKVWEGSFSTINHGDSWTNNFLFRYDDEGSVVHTKLVDFQIVRYTSPVLDLLYFLFSSTRPDMLSESIHDLIKIYSEALASDLEKLQIDHSEVPSLEDIHREMKDRSIFGVISMITISPFAVAKPSDTENLRNLDLEEAEGSDDCATEIVFRNGHYQQLIIKYMDILEKMGYLRSAEELVVNKRIEKGCSQGGTTL